MAISSILGAGCAPTPPPCDGTWGRIGDPDQSVHVRGDGDDADPGTHEAPVATLEAALGLVRAGGWPRIAVGPGTFDVALDLQATPPGGGDDSGLIVEGCGPDHTTFVAADPAAPTVKVTAATGIEIRDLSLVGGTTPLWIWSGGGLSADHVSISGPEVAGFVVDGPYTLADFGRLEVSDVQAVAGVGGYGGIVSGAVVAWAGGGVRDSVAAGVLVDGSTAYFEAAGITIADTQPDVGGAFGRGLQIQNYATADLRDMTFSDNHDAALFALLASSLSVTDSAFLDTRAAGGDGGDAVVVTGVDVDGRLLDPTLFAAALNDNVIDGADRAGIVFERVDGQVDGNQIAGTLVGNEIVSQQGALISGGDPVVELVAPLPLERVALGGL